MDKKFEPFIEAIMHPDIEEVAGLDELATQELTGIIKSFSDEDILGLAMENEEHKGQYGFILNPRAFGILKSKERLATIMTALLSRFGEAQKNKSDWKEYVCKFRETK